jgi:hypothetical protein
MFNGFTGIDRQTELNDDDGTLTGLSNSVQKQPALEQTISVNDDNFFTAPVETPQCLSNIGKNSTPDQACKQPLATEAPVTAKTSPYDYVATVVWHPEKLGLWSSDCTNPQCYGVPLFRQFFAGTDNRDAAGSSRDWYNWYANSCRNTDGTNADTKQCRWPFIRMAGAAIATRETLTVNHGTYYLDTTVPLSMQQSEDFNQQGGPDQSRNTSFNVFEPGETYTEFFLYAKSSTQQKYQIYVGTKDPKNGSVTPVQVKIPDGNLVPKPITGPADWLQPDTSQVASTGIVTVTVDFSKVTNLDPTKDAGLCQPHTFCTKSGDSCVSTLPTGNPLKKHYDRVCGWAVKDLDCPADGCYGFQFTLPAADIFKADATPDNPSPHRPQPTAFPAPDWGTQFVQTLVQPDSESSPPKDYGPSCYYKTVPTQACLDQ